MKWMNTPNGKILQATEYNHLPEKEVRGVRMDLVDIMEQMETLDDVYGEDIWGDM